MPPRAVIPGLRPTFLLGFGATALIAIFLSLGFWQLERAELRRNQDVLKQEQAQLSPVYITSFPEESLEELADRRVRLRGHYLPQQFLLDNQVHEKQPGYHVLSPFELSPYGQVVLVNRGWVPAGARRDRLPHIPIPEDAEIQIEGTVYFPQQNPFTNQDYLLEGHGWPQVVQGIDYPRLAARRAGPSLVPATIRLADDQPHGHTRIWPTPPMTAEKHVGYAIQWFALAGATLVLFLLFFARTSSKGG